MRRLSLLSLCVLLPLPVQAYTLGPAQVTVSGYVEGRGIYAVDKDTPTERPSALFKLTGKSTLDDWGALSVSLRGIYDGKIQDPQAGWPLSSLDKVYQDRNPSLRVDEAYLDLFMDKVDLRLGIQKFAWGRLDEINPTDNLNSEDLTDPLLNDESERKLGTPAVKANIYTDAANFELAWIPRYRPYRLPFPDERWFPAVMRPPSSIQTNTPLGAIPVTASYADIDLPAFSLRNSEAGIRCSRSIDDWEFSASYFSGYDPQPVYGAPTELIVDMPNPLALKPEVLAEVRVQPELHRMQVFGLDFSTTYQGFTFRGEGALLKGKRYFRTVESVYPEIASSERQRQIMDAFLREFLITGRTRQSFFFDPAVAIRKDALKCGLGVDYIRGDATISGQCILEHLLDYDVDQPIYFIKDGDALTLTLAYKRFFLQNTLELTLGGMYDPLFAHVAFQPIVVYSITDNLKATLGAVVIAGRDPDSLLGQFRDNDEAFCKLRYNF